MNEHFLSWLIPWLFLAISHHAEAAPQSSFAVRQVVEAPAPDAEEFTLKYPAGQETLHLARVPLLDANAVRHAKVEKDALGYFHINVTLTLAGAKRLEEFTTKHVGGRLAILLNRKIASAPFVREPIREGVFTITGNFSEAEAHQLARRINESANPKGA